MYIYRSTSDSRTLGCLYCASAGQHAKHSKESDLGGANLQTTIESHRHVAPAGVDVDDLVHGIQAIPFICKLQLASSPQHLGLLQLAATAAAATTAHSQLTKFQQQQWLICS